MSRRGLTVLGGALMAGAGYYLYTAGGDPKVAQKNLEADAAKASAKLKSDLPGKEKEAQKKAEAVASSAGQKLDNTVADAKLKLSDAQAKTTEFKNEAGKEIKQGLDKFDKTVERKTAEAKSGISSWFGGK